MGRKDYGFGIFESERTTDMGRKDYGFGISLSQIRSPFPQLLSACFDERAPMRTPGAHTVEVFQKNPKSVVLSEHLCADSFFQDEDYAIVIDFVVFPADFRCKLNEIILGA